MFQPVDAVVSGIDFNNRIEHADTLSVIDFEYMYNGAGVAVGDINQDGLQDIYFTGNMVSSRLYLNKGGFKFEDITVPSGTGTATWANGVCMADFNQDGRLDIYVSVGGHRFTPESERHNLLFINNGDLTFTESAAAYGLDDDGYNVHAALIDYDLDGDQDVYLLRNSFVNYSRNMSRPRLSDGEAHSTDKLMRNNGNNTFTDVSRQAGILMEGFGLGVNICYINEDCLPDIYVSNDFLSNDLMWVNNGDGTFTNQAARLLKHQTFNGMGNDVADYNNDGLPDIVVVDMLPEDNKRWKLTPRGNTYDEFEKGLRMGYEPQYVRNTLQLNNGNGTFSDVGQMAGVEATEWSWSALFADFDHDGWKDLFISNGYGKDITNQDFIVYGEEGKTMGLPAATKKERQELLNKIPGVKLSNYMYRNKGDLTFSDETKAWGFDFPTYSNGAAYADLDNDGDLDLVINNIDDKATVMENRLRVKGEKESAAYLRIRLEGPEKNRSGYGTRVEVRHDGIRQTQVFAPWRGYLSTVEPFLHFGMPAKTDTVHVTVQWPDGRKQQLDDIASDQVLILKYTDAAPATDGCRSIPESDASARLFQDITQDSGLIWSHEENYFVDFKVQPALPHMFSRNGPGMAVGDLDGDGLEDLVVGGASGQRWMTFIQQPDETFRPRSFEPIDTLAESMGLLLFDADGDGDNDLYAVSGGSEHEKSSRSYQDVLYLNDGRGGMRAAPEALPKETASGSCVSAADFDRDGDLDLFIGGRVTPEAYPMPAKSMILRNDSKSGQAAFTDITEEVAPDLTREGMICAAVWSDADGDGWLDLITAGEFTPISIFRNRNGQLKDRETIPDSEGWWNSLLPLDMDNDGDMDYMAGNLGLNSHFRAAAEEPLCIHASDYNQDGRIDPMMSHYVQGVNHLGHPRDVLVDQINSMRKRFRSFKEYSEATFEESFLPEELADAYVVCARRFENSWLENIGDGDFRMHALPMEMQTAPVYGMVTEDFNRDGHHDVLAVGNSYSPEVISGRDDASIGWYLEGGASGWQPKTASKTGFLSDGDAKSLVRLQGAKGTQLIITANNNGPLKVHRGPVMPEVVLPASDDRYVEIEMADGKTLKREIHRGSGYLSQGSVSIIVPKGATAIRLFDFQGKSRLIPQRKR